MIKTVELRIKTVELCEKCAKPLWEGLCGYCKGYRDGVIDTKNRKVNENIIEIVSLKKGDIFPSVEGVKDEDIEYREIKKGGTETSDTPLNTL